jgi:hypothetical protein
MMSTDIALVLQNTVRSVAAKQARHLLRFALYSGELLRIPRNKRRLHVLLGTAWISVSGRDIVASPGSCAKIGRPRHPVLVSALGGGPLLVEIW